MQDLAVCEACQGHKGLTRHRYPLEALLLDGLRAGFGIVATTGPLLFLDVASPLAIVLGALGGVFLVFALRVLTQGLSSIEVSDSGISRHGAFARHLAWSDVAVLKLDHFAVRRRPSDGWFQLTLKGNHGVLKIDSTIDAFDDIVAAAAEAAKANGMAFDPTTTLNLQELGHAEVRSLSSDDDEAMGAG